MIVNSINNNKLAGKKWMINISMSFKGLQKALLVTAISTIVFSYQSPALAADSENVIGLPRVEPETQGMSSARFRLLTQMLKQHVDDGRVAGLVAGVARNGKIVYLESMGWQDVENRLPMRPTSLFQIRSMSKPITAVATMQLVEQGRLKLSDPVSKYLPKYANMEVYISPDAEDNSATRPASREMTIEDLLMNTAGLSHRNGALYRLKGVRRRADNLQQLVDKVAAVPLVADPGTKWIYSISITVLGRIVELVSGQAFDDYLQDKVFSPLAMSDTGFFVPGNKVDRLAHIYRVPNGGGPISREADMSIPITVNPPLLEGAAGMVSSVPDYLRFLQGMLNDGVLEEQRFLKAKTVSLMTQNHIPEALMPIGFGPRVPMLDRGWGYGLSVVVDEAQSTYGVNNGEFGWSGSLGTFSWADPETETVAVLMLQMVPSRSYNLSEKFKALVSQALLD